MLVLPELLTACTSKAARCFAAFCAAASLGSMLCDRSHQTVAFCFRISATYDVGLFVAVERPEVERRGKLTAEAVVPCLCILIVLEVEECRECVEEGTRAWPG